MSVKMRENSLEKNTSISLGQTTVDNKSNLDIKGVVVTLDAMTEYVEYSKRPALPNSTSVVILACDLHKEM